MKPSRPATRFIMRVAYLNAIKSVRQRALVQHWREIGGGRLPSFERFQPSPAEHDPRQLIGWIVEGESDNRRFRTLQHGKFLSEAFGVDPLPLQPMQAVVPESLQKLAFDGLNECADACAPVYWVISTRDDGGRRVNCERLLLPFGESNKAMQIVASLQLISYDGEFTRQTVLTYFAGEATITFKAQIAFREQGAPVTDA
jgi:hypothetical protein